MRRTVLTLPAIVLLAAGCAGHAVEDGTTLSPAVPTTRTSLGATTTAALGTDLEALGAFQRKPVPSAATCPPGSAPDVPGDPDALRPPAADLDWGLAAFDRESGLLVYRGSNWTWVFDPCRNRWEERAAEGPDLGPSAYTSLVYDEDSDLVVAFDEDAVWTYDTEADLWARLPDSLPSAEGQVRYHPPSGLIVLFEESNDAAWAYDVDSATRFSLGSGVPQRGLVAYDRVAGRFILYQVASRHSYPATWEYVPGQGWNRVGGAPGAEFVWGDLYNGEEIAFDEAGGRVALLSSGQLAAFDSTLPNWEVLYTVTRVAVPVDGPDFRFGAQLVCDSANGRLIALGGWHVAGDGQVPATDVWAYDTAAREWTLLLAAAE